MSLSPHQTRPHGRSLSDFLDSKGKLRPAETKLLAAAARGKTCIIASERPEAATPENTIRAPFLRFLALGGDDNNPLHEHGIQLIGAWIEETLDLNFCALPAPLGLSKCHIPQLDAIQATLPSLALSGSLLVDKLDADGITVKVSVFLRNGFIARGEVRFLGACIGGNLDCSDGTFNTETDRALSCYNAEIKGNVFLNNGFTATGGVRLLGAHIGGDLDCDGGTFTPKTGSSYALSCDSAEIKGNVFLNNGFTATGEVRLLGAHIGGNLDCSGGTFTPKTGDALSCDSAEIKGNVFLRNGFTATGEVRLLGARISGNLVCSDGTFNTETGYALSCDSAEIKESVFLNNGFTATAEVRLLGAHIGSNLACDGGTFTPKTGYALSCDSAEIRGGVFLGYGEDPRTKQKIPFKTSGQVDFTAVTLGTLIDDPAVWPEPGSLILNGIRIARFGGSAPTSGAARVEWLLRQKKLHLTTDFRPQPWEETIRILREMGHDQDAKIVAIAKQDQLRKSGHYKGLARDIHALWGAVAGYGYRPDKLLICMATVWLSCALIYIGGAQHGLFAPTSPVIQTNPQIRQQCAPDRWTTCALPDEYTSFSPFYYSLDLILPVIDLQQEKDWAPVVTRNGEKIKAGEGLRWLMWLEILIGWLGSLLLIAIFTNLIKKD